jgi:hypothetical protein
MRSIRCTEEAYSISSLAWASSDGAIVSPRAFAVLTLMTSSNWNLTRWLSPRTIKETFAPPRDWRYPFLSSEQ